MAKQKLVEHGQEIWIGEQIRFNYDGFFVSLELDVYCKRKHALFGLSESYKETFGEDLSSLMIVELSDPKTIEMVLSMYIDDPDTYNIHEQLDIATHIVTFLDGHGNRHIDIENGLFRIRPVTPKKLMKVEES